jgi:hypothetical protein
MRRLGVLAIAEHVAGVAQVCGAELVAQAGRGTAIRSLVEGPRAGDRELVVGRGRRRARQCCQDAGRYGAALFDHLVGAGE